MRPMFDLYAEFIVITNALEQPGVEYAVCGGRAQDLADIERLQELADES